jgi:hypothetical protein
VLTEAIQENQGMVRKIYYAHYKKFEKLKARKFFPNYPQDRITNSVNSDSGQFEKSFMKPHTAFVLRTAVRLI